jgi:hypothetical protein
LHTALNTTKFIALFGASKQLTPAFACAHLGAPQKVIKESGGRVAWVYGRGRLVFKADRVDGGHLSVVGVTVNAPLAGEHPASRTVSRRRGLTRRST